MKYFISITDLHSTLIEGMRRDGDIVLHFPKRGSRGEKLRTLPRILGLAIRVLCDRESHVHVSHPFSVVTAALMWPARRASFFDDGTAYYTSPPLPSGRREAIDRWMTRRFVPWEEVLEIPDATYVDMIRVSKTEEFYSMFPELMGAFPIPVAAIDLGRAFPRSDRSEPGISVFLDTMDLPMSDELAVAIIRRLESAAAESSDGLLHFKSHPAEVSRISQELRSKPWARELAGVWETLIAQRSISRLFSYYSSGAIGLKLTQPECVILNFQHSSQRIDDGLRALFELLGATDCTPRIGHQPTSNDPTGSHD